MWRTVSCVPYALCGVFIAAVLISSASAQCPQNLGSCKCIPPSVPGAAKPVLDCSQVSDANEFQNIQGLQGGQPGGPPIFSQIVVRRSQLQEIPPNAFGIAQADEYIIENNPSLETIERGALGRNASPRIISIRNNPLLESIQYEDWSRFVDLEKVFLNDNRLLEVPDFAFDGVSTKLKEIHLQRNVILDIGSFAFRGLPALQTVNLAENQIGAIEGGALFFSSPPELVDMSRNRIVNMDGEAFIDPSFPNRGAYAKHIDLSNNAISMLDRNEWETILTQLDKLEKIANPTAAPSTTTEAPPPPPPPAAQPAQPAAAPAAGAAAAPAPLPPNDPAALSAAVLALATGAEPRSVPAAAAAAPAPGPAAPAAAPAVAPPAPSSEISILQQILEKLQLLTGLNNLGGGGGAASAPAAVEPPVAAAGTGTGGGGPAEPAGAPVAIEASLSSFGGVLGLGWPSHEGPLMGRFKRSPLPHFGSVQGNLQGSSSSAPDAMVSAFQPFFKGKDELLAAIKTNPEAAVAAANAVRVAAESAAASASAVENAAAGAAAAVERAVVAAVKGLPPPPSNSNNDAESSSSDSASARSKRQAPAEPVPVGNTGSQPIVPPAKVYTINFAGNPLHCNCDVKWIQDFRHRYEDQLQNLNCIETRDSIFKLDVNFWISSAC